MVGRCDGDPHAAVVPHLTLGVFVHHNLGGCGDIGVVADPVGDVGSQGRQRRLHHRFGTGRTDDRQRRRTEGIDPPGGDDIGQVGDVVTVQMGEQQCGQVLRADADRGHPHQHTATAVDEERVLSGSDQCRRPGPVGVDHRASGTGQDDFDHLTVLPCPRCEQASARPPGAVAWCEIRHNGIAPGRTGGWGMRIADILRSKGSAVATVTATTTVTALLAELAIQNVGSMVVIGSGGIVGLVSERDVVRKLHEHGPELFRRPVSDVMSAVAVTCGPEDRVDDLAALMTDNRVRHVPVLVDGRLAGIVSIGDVVKSRMQEMSAEHQQLKAYITQGG